MVNGSEKAVVVNPNTAPVERAASIKGSKQADGGPVEATSGSKTVFRFAKLWAVTEPLKFRDGTEFKFRPIRRNNMPGYSPTSSLETTDEKLAENLRELAKTNRSIREAPSKQVRT